MLTTTETMGAWAFDRYGACSNLQYHHLPRPQPEPDEVLIRVRAVGLNDWDVQMVAGELTNRMMNGLSRPKHIRIPGSDIAGEVVMVGSEVTRFRPGDYVFGDTSMNGGFGGFAEYACARESVLMTIPRGMNCLDAAAIPQAGQLALQGIRMMGRLTGARLALNGGGGGVGTFALQLAREQPDVEITIIDSASKLPLLKEAGADYVIDYRKEDFTRGKWQYDGILDAKTTRWPVAHLRALVPGGTYATVGGDLMKVAHHAALAGLARRFTEKHLRVVVLRPARDLAYLADAYSRGVLNPVIDGPWPFDQLPAALAHLENGEHFGKVVVSI